MIQKGSVSSVKTLAIVLFLAAGTISTFCYKLQNYQDVSEGDRLKKFFHPYMQSFTMFFGQALCLLLFLQSANKHPTALQEGKTPHQFHVFFIPAAADACSSMLQYAGLSIISGSTYMMFKGASIVTTAIFSKLLFQMEIHRRHLFGCSFAIIGITIVGSSGLFDSDDSSSSFDKEFVGYILMVISLIFNGLLYAYEQLLMRRHSINPMQMVGVEGVFGLVIITVVALALSITPCMFAENSCVFDSYDHPYMERFDVFFIEVVSDWHLALLVVSGVLLIAIYNLNGVRITKLFDALTRSLLNVTKTSVVWIVGIIITISAGDNGYKMESLNLVVNLIKATGFAFIIVGTLVYNRLIFATYFADKPALEHRDTIISSEEALTKSLISLASEKSQQE